jgi:P-type Cu+ transporter
MKEIVLNVEGMTCTSCANQIERELNKLSQTQAQVNYATATALISNPGNIGLKKFIETIESLGYKASLDEIDEAFALKRLKRQRDFAIVIGVFAFTVSMFTQFQFYGWQWVLLILTIILHGYSAIDIHRTAFRAAKNRFANMDTLISLGTLVALLVSVYSLFFTQMGMLGMKMQHTFFERATEGGLYLEVAAVVPAFILAGRYFEVKAKHRNLDAVSALKKLSREEITVIRDGLEINISAREILMSDLLLVKPGERIVVDGLVVSGQSDVDESIISGESLPVFKTVDSQVIAGSTPIDGFLKISPTKIGKDSVVGQIEQLILASQNEKTQTQRLVDKISSVFVPVILVLSLLTFLIWLLVGANAGFALSSALAVLIIACPCALGLATPIAVLVSSAIANNHQILIRSGKALEKANAIKTIFLDKTGTITEGELEVVEFKQLADDSVKLDSIIFSLTNLSTHPVSQTINHHHNALIEVSVENYSQVAGEGIYGEVNATKYKLGNLNWLGFDSEFIDHPLGVRLVGLANESQLLAYWLLSDKLRTDSVAAVAELKNMNLEVVMLTGDGESSAQGIANQVGISQVYSNLNPNEKVQKINDAKSNGQVVAFVGDGLNDAAALSTANLSIAFASGSYVALAASDITIISGGLAQVVRALKLSKKTLNTIKGNLFWAFAYNSAMIPIAMLGYLQPIWAGAAMALSSTFVVANSLVLKYRKF